MSTTAKVIGTVAAATALSHLVVYRVLFGVPRLDPHDVAGDRWVPLVVAATLVLMANGWVGRLYGSRLAAIGGAAIAALTTELYFIAIDWCEVGWGHEVGHDVFLGDQDYWLLSVVRAAILCFAFATVAAASWRVRRHVGVHAAG